MSLLLLIAAAPARELPLKSGVNVKLARLPQGGIQPQAAVDSDGHVHVIYLAGDPMTSDVFYIRSTDGGESFSEPLRVNSQAGSAIAVGSVRGAHLALGRDGWVHVAWMGSGHAQPKAPGKHAPMLYSRAQPGGEFEPQRNVIQNNPGLDGGGSIAADREGNVYVAWHAPEAQPGEDHRQFTEADRRVWITRSRNDGERFAPEKAVSEKGLGVCACCGMRLLADRDGRLWGLYRSATDQLHRDTWLLSAGGPGASFGATKIGPMQSGVCIMSTAALLESGSRLLAAWQTQEQIYWGTTDPEWQKVTHDSALPGQGKARKHPALAADDKGQTLIAWTEGTEWGKGGSVLWQIFDRNRQPVAGAGGRADDLPVWDFPAVFTRPDGTFVVLY